jgi:hypothetical protein
MTSTLSLRPRLNDLQELIDKVPEYPVNNPALVEFAAKIKAPKKVVDFYRSFSDQQVYQTKDELASISEQVDLMRQEEADMPREIERGPEEY